MRTIFKEDNLISGYVFTLDFELMYNVKKKFWTNLDL